MHKHSEAVREQLDVRIALTQQSLIMCSVFS